MLDSLFSSVETLRKGLNASWLRNEVIANNIANVDTPGFKASRVRFEELMEESAGAGGGLEMAVTDEQHIHGSGASAMARVEPESSQTRPRPSAWTATTSILKRNGGAGQEFH